MTIFKAFCVYTKLPDLDPGQFDGLTGMPDEKQKKDPHGDRFLSF